MKAKCLIFLVILTTYVFGFMTGSHVTARKRQTETRCDTVFAMVHDTVTRPVTRRIIRYESVPADTVRDTVYLPIEQVEYQTPDYHAWVSGYAASLDSITIRQQIITRTVTKNHRWGAGIAAGYGVSGPYLGIGIHYNIIGW